METRTARVSRKFNATPGRVWEALTTPEQIKQYLFGTDTTTDWKVGSPIFYRGVWEGKSYEDKGVILACEPKKKLVTSYWSSFSPLPDAPENYQKITYELQALGNQTELIITQTGPSTPETQAHSESNWRTVLDSMAGIVER